MSSKQNGPCKLCGVKAKLIRKSHIIPDFLFDGIRDPKNRMAIINQTDDAVRSRVQEHSVFDKYILCDKCDNGRISKLERYASLLFNGGLKPAPIFERRKGPDGIRTIHISNIDYKKLKLFVLSMLWRAHISEQKFFARVKLSDSAAQQLKHYLITEDPGNEVDFRVTIMVMQDVKNNLVRMTIDPWVGLIEGKLVATFFISGYTYFINIDSEAPMELQHKAYLKESGEIEIPILTAEQSFNFLKAMGLAGTMARFMTYHNVKEEPVDYSLQPQATWTLRIGPIERIG